MNEYYFHFLDELLMCKWNYNHLDYSCDIFVRTNIGFGLSPLKRPYWVSPLIWCKRVNRFQSLFMKKIARFNLEPNIKG